MSKMTINVKLYTSEIIYDVQNKTFLTGRSRLTGDNAELVAAMQANDDEEHEGQIMRSIGNAFNILKTKLSEHIEDMTTDRGNNILRDKDENMVITLKMPSNYNRAAVDGITTALHEYIVNYTIGEWFTITDKPDAEDYFSMAGTNLLSLKEAVNKRVRPVRVAPTANP